MTVFVQNEAKFCKLSAVSFYNFKRNKKKMLKTPIFYQHQCGNELSKVLFGNYNY